MGPQTDVGADVLDLLEVGRLARSFAHLHTFSLPSELNLLRNVEAINQESGAAAKSSSLLSSFRSSSSYNHETETIFALPRMQLDFKSIHVQDPDEPSLTGGPRVDGTSSSFPPIFRSRFPTCEHLVASVADASRKPVVECSVVTEFTDHICVTMDAELIMFLHDLVSAYLKEKEKGLVHLVSRLRGEVGAPNATFYKDLWWHLS